LQLALYFVAVIVYFLVLPVIFQISPAFVVMDVLVQATEETDEFLRRVFAVALTDSVHRLRDDVRVSDRVTEFFTQVELYECTMTFL